ncbi:hypothetical protein EVAR_54609_1 [Eumeta japonica]|uniref:Uncharacterized protein n=1 Tax=Eumeta variegata TaxID=151549 RepID=A0A4C1YIF0_EUMVA|nr:hypothetical protein EVAR_54609_1 [Eumeta japonica]
MKWTSQRIPEKKALGRHTYSEMILQGFLLSYGTELLGRENRKRRSESECVALERMARSIPVTGQYVRQQRVASNIPTQEGERKKDTQRDNTLRQTDDILNSFRNLEHTNRYLLLYKHTLLTYSSDFGAPRLDPCELRTVVPYTYTLSERSAGVTWQVVVLGFIFVTEFLDSVAALKARDESYAIGMRSHEIYIRAGSARRASAPACLIALLKWDFFAQNPKPIMDVDLMSVYSSLRPQSRWARSMSSGARGEKAKVAEFMKRPLDVSTTAVSSHAIRRAR